MTEALRLLRRIRQWDMLDVADDGPYWKREIDALLARADKDAAGQAGQESATTPSQEGHAAGSAPAAPFDMADAIRSALGRHAARAEAPTPSGKPPDAGVWEGNAQGLTALLIERDALVAQVNALIAERDAALPDAAPSAPFDLAAEIRARLTAETPTPETDAFAKVHCKQIGIRRDASLVYDEEHVLDFARRLERQRDAALSRERIADEWRKALAAAYRRLEERERLANMRADEHERLAVEWKRRAFRAEEAKAAAQSATQRSVDIVFDGPPGHVSGRFVEVESPPGKSIKFGEWLKRDDGYWVLRCVASSSAGEGKDG